MATVVQMVDLYGLTHEILRRVADGSLDHKQVEAQLGAIIGEAIPAWELAEREVDTAAPPPPLWWRTADEQLARATELWPYQTLPDAPVGFIARSETEVLLLHVPRPFDELWAAVVPPDGYTKSRWLQLVLERIESLPDVRINTRPAWRRFNYQADRTTEPRHMLRYPGCLASEILSVIIQFPEWLLTEAASTSMTVSAL
ncbi:hypothetical protein SBI67_01110 [Mycolicibacterium sp. 120266]|uniref:hypothetical protein n=1 Tax=Mycolicibacterium sp. 120266 TaxID=3090601 RepID=UPI00299D27F9|nr:hypothetical protein [Mycolicibacterium sp. 120266]MDX1870707.1 hypothetical protein [Mycolicibacterium sp. 120266]